MIATINKINSFLDLKPGWHYGTGQAPSHRQVGRALAILAYISFRVSKTDAFPGIDGEIMITGYSESDNFAVTLELDGTFRFEFERDGEEQIYKENLSSLELIRLIDDTTMKILERKWNSFDWLISNTTTTLPQGNFETWHSGRMVVQTAVRVYPALARSAPISTVNQSATTPGASTQTYQQNRPSFGGLTNQIFQTEAA